ncbi:hypothetical protein BUALT_Bualt06G0029800 [Buddleja alternifolia]|uniref:Uncharacterized protein n=1 Tax=Buddleja alternifolia TaxID=168488 RepID=A0AAV6XN21_9LAMI|nr:hypothetical protein BUALT_Bualt06G0029800 [Buddleja alternifolia]
MNTISFHSIAREKLELAKKFIEEISRDKGKGEVKKGVLKSAEKKSVYAVLDIALVILINLTITCNSLNCWNRSLIEDSRAGIKISPQDNYYPGLHDRLVTVTGALGEQIRAVELILLKLVEDPYYQQSANTPFPYAGIGFLNISHLFLFSLVTLFSSVFFSLHMVETSNLPHCQQLCCTYFPDRESR